jgi:hypothetical protein
LRRDELYTKAFHVRDAATDLAFGTLALLNGKSLTETTGEAAERENASVSAIRPLNQRLQALCGLTDDGGCVCARNLGSYGACGRAAWLPNEGRYHARVQETWTPPTGIGYAFLK